MIAGNDTVLTFDPHPLAIVRPEAAPKLLTSFELRAELIAALGVQELVVISFDDGFAHESPRQFIDEVLVGRLGATHVSVGENFRLRLPGQPATPDAAGGRWPLRARASCRSSRSTVRSSLKPDPGARHRRRDRGRRALIGGPFMLRGEVVHGDRRGRELGFPTANIVPDEALCLPGHGVYAATVGDALAAVSVGVRPTFGTGRAVLVEAYLLDRDEDLYGEVLTIEFVARLRGERRFASVDELIDQMRLRRRAACANCAAEAPLLASIAA